MQEKVEIITNHIVHFWTILDKNTQKRILCKTGDIGHYGPNYELVQNVLSNEI